MNVTRYACAGLLVTAMLGGKGQTQEDPYFEWLKQQGGQQQPAPAPETPFPQTSPPAEIPAPAPSPAPTSERFLASYSAGGYYTSFVISGSRLERRTTKNGLPAGGAGVALADIEVIEIGECGFTVRAAPDSVTTVGSNGQQSRGRFLLIVDDWDVSSRAEAKAVADKVISAVGVPTVDIGDEDCWW